MPWMLLFAVLLAPIPETSGKELTLDMHERFAYAAMMRTALIHGYLDRARRHAGQLSELLAGTESQGIADLAREVSVATDINTAALGVAKVGEACGSCHAENRVTPVVLGQVPKPDGESLAARMGRHIWAADQMWAGLISHALLPWQRGAKALSRKPFIARESEIVQSQVDTVSAIAAEASAPQSWPSRAEIYGRFLAACADCHRTYGAASTRVD